MIPEVYHQARLKSMVEIHHTFMTKYKLGQESFLLSRLVVFLNILWFAKIDIQIKKWVKKVVKCCLKYVSTLETGHRIMDLMELPESL
jgi:hypothetical protein